MGANRFVGAHVILKTIFPLGQIVLTPVVTPKWTLEQFLAGVHSDNLHHEIDTGVAVGNEAW